MKKLFSDRPLNLYALMAIFCAILFSVMTFILEPLYLMTSSDVLLSSTPLLNIMDIVCELAETSAFAICYSIIIYAAIKKSTRKAWGLFGLYCALCAVRRLCVLGITYFTYFIDIGDIFSVASAFILECTLVFIITLILAFNAGKYRNTADNMQKVARTSSDSVKRTNLSSVFSKDDPLQKYALTAGIIVVSVKIAMRIISDISYGAPDSFGEVIIMVVYYLMDILMGVMFYAIAWLTLSKLFKKDTQKSTPKDL